MRIALGPNNHEPKVAALGRWQYIAREFSWCPTMFESEVQTNTSPERIQNHPTCQHDSVFMKTVG